jgi:hypothetical protein
VRFGVPAFPRPAAAKYGRLKATFPASDLIAGGF